MRIGRILLALLGLVLIIWLLVIGFRALFGGDDSQDTAQTTGVTNLVDYTGTGNVRWTQSGKIVAPENHIVVAITVNASSRTMVVSRGYEGQSILTQTFTNDQSSFNAFMSALQQVGFLKEQTPQSGASPEGSCPGGNRYYYQLYETEDMMLHNTWSASCGARIGSFAGNAASVRQLFQAQIPNYSTLYSQATKK